MTPQQVLTVQETKASTSTSTPPAEGAEAVPAIPARALELGLTRRELGVLRLMAQGMTNAQIAEHLALSPVTINAHLRSIYSKLGVASRTQAMRIAYDHKLL